jgi:hypothetical protein
MNNTDEKAEHYAIGGIRSIRSNDINNRNDQDIQQ